MKAHESILLDLKKGNYRPVYFLTGDEPYFIDLISDHIEKHCLSESEKAFNQLVLYGKEVNPMQIMDTARQFPMMAQRRVVLVKEAQEMKDIAGLEPYMKNPSPQTVLVLNFKYKKLDGRTSFAKILKKNAVYFESKRLYDSHIPAWIKSYLRKQQKSIDDRSAMLLSEYLGNDLSKITNELDKLMLNISDKKEVSAQDIEDNVGISKDFNVFELQNALGEKDKTKALRIMQYFIANPKKNHPLFVNSMLFRFFSKVYLTKDKMQLDDRALAKALKMSSTFFIKDYRTAARNFSWQKLHFIFDQLLLTDMRLKGIHNHHVSDGELLKELSYHILD